MDYSLEDIAKMMDHSLLSPKLTDEDLDEGCAIARRHAVASVCIKPYYVARAAELLEGSDVETGTTVGFPQGGHATSIKVAEAVQALKDGATELDMVANIGKVLSGDWHYVQEDISALEEAAHEAGAILKVIFENCYLEDEHKIRLCEICAEVGADFVKTSTGYGGGGATLEDLKLMREHSPAHVRVKAAGGVRTLDVVLEMREIGVARIGTSSTVAILEECKERLGN